MCRVLAYLGPERSLQGLLLEPPHSLEVQSYAPKEMEDALLNADGFGVAWYAEGITEPARYRTALPMWADENVRDFATQVSSRCVLAAVRSATPGIGHGIANTQPFTHGPLTFLHNGYIRGFRDGPMRAIRKRLSDEAYGAIRGTSDSEHLFGIFLDHWLAERDIEAALSHTLDVADDTRNDRTALLSMIASDGEQLCAVTEAFDGTPPTLYRRDDDGTLIASEPITPGDWIPFARGEVARFR